MEQNIQGRNSIKQTLKKKRTKREFSKRKKEKLKTSFLDSSTQADRLLFAKLNRLLGKDYEDPYKAGAEKMTRYFDSFLEFIREEYPESSKCKGNLRSLIPEKTLIKLPDSTIITVRYKMDNKEADYDISNKDNSIEKITNRHIEIAQMFKSNIQEGIFRIVTMLLEALPKDKREEMESKYLRKARHTEKPTSKDKEQK